MSAATDSLIDALADSVGIERSYRDVDGRTQQISAETRYGLLLAMGLDLSSAASIEAELQMRLDTTWRNLLPSVVIVRRTPNKVLSCPVTLNESLLTRSLDWCVQSEQGEIFAGKVSPTSLEETERRHAGGCLHVRVRLPLPAELGDGYHRITISSASSDAAATLIITPPAAFIPEWLERGERRWGIACPLFSLWSGNSWGIGDFSDLAVVACAAKKLGAAFVGLNPLHSPLPGEQFDPSPYLPSSRIFLNPLHIDIASILGTATEQFTASIRQVQAATLVDYPVVCRLKNEALEAACRLHDWHNTTAFRESQGEQLTQYGVFNALQERFGKVPWHQWPSSVRMPTSPGINEFARQCADRVDFHITSQCIADQQLAAAAAKMDTDDAESGLYQDLSVGVSPDGADAWANQDIYVAGASIGAPPDAFNPAGQNWGTPPPNPLALGASGYATFVAMLRANMRHAKVLRIDHVMGLQRLYWIPSGVRAKSGAYVRYPLDDLISIVALESHRNRCLVVGEDLGTLPEGFRDRMAGSNILSCRLLMFERYPSGLFCRPLTYPRLAVATSGTHDLPSIRSWWKGRDIEIRRTLGLSTPDEATLEMQQRSRDRELLRAALEDQQLNGEQEPEAFEALVLAIERFLARSPSALMVANLSDLLSETVQINVPGTVSEQPNWRHRYRLSVDAIVDDPWVLRIAAAIAAERSQR